MSFKVNPKKPNTFWNGLIDFFKGVSGKSGVNSAFESSLLPAQSSGYQNQNTAIYGTPDNASIFAGTENAITGNLDYQRTLDQLLRTQEFNRDEAQKNRDFQEYLSNTAYQRQMADLEAAGINPSLVLGQGGASAASGSAASASSSRPNAVDNRVIGALINGMMNVTNSALKSQMYEEQTERLVALKQANGKKQAPVPDYIKNYDYDKRTKGSLPNKIVNFEDIFKD